MKIEKRYVFWEEIKKIERYNTYGDWGKREKCMNVWAGVILSRDTKSIQCKNDFSAFGGSYPISLAYYLKLILP